MPTFNQFDVVVVPFPFTDRAATKRRPALVLSDASHFNNKIGQSVMAMITSAQHSNWPLDVVISSLEETGLSAPSVIRMKLFTLDHRLVLRSCGTLAEQDRETVGRAMAKLLPPSY